LLPDFRLYKKKCLPAKVTLKGLAVFQRLAPGAGQVPAAVRTELGKTLAAQTAQHLDQQLPVEEETPLEPAKLCFAGVLAGMIICALLKGGQARASFQRKSPKHQKGKWVGTKGLVDPDQGIDVMQQEVTDAQGLGLKGG
jgi:hypothetical protein